MNTLTSNHAVCGAINTFLAVTQIYYGRPVRFRSVQVDFADEHTATARVTLVAMISVTENPTCVRIVRARATLSVGQLHGDEWAPHAGEQQIKADTETIVFWRTTPANRLFHAFKLRNRMGQTVVGTNFHDVQPA